MDAKEGVPCLVWEHMHLEGAPSWATPCLDDSLERGRPNELGRRVGPHFGEDTGNFGELSPGRRIHSVHRRTSTQIADFPCLIVEFGESIFKLNVDTLADPIDDRIDSSSKIDLCPLSVDTYSLNASSLFCNDCVDQPIYPIVCFAHRDHVLENISKNDMCFFEVEFACFNSSLVVDHSPFKYNILFEDDEIIPSDVPSGVNLESSIVLDSYTCYSNPLWCEAFPPKDGNLFSEDESTLVGKEGDEEEGGVCFPITSSSWCVSLFNGMTITFEPTRSHTYVDTLEEVDLRDTFLYYLFTYDEAHAVEWSMKLENESANREKGEVLDPSPWISFPFDLGSELNCGTYVVMLGQNDKYHLDGFVDTFPYDGKSFLRVYNPIEEPTLCMRKSSFLSPFLYSCFEYDLADRTFYEGRSSLLRKGEVYFKFAMISLCVPSCKVVCARILEPSCDITYENTLDVPSEHDAFLYYLFAYDDTHVCVRTIFCVNSGINGANESLIDSMLYFSLPFDLGVGLNCDGYGSNTLFLS
uniref:Uncharacterized protein n=1 Tax=Solanum tuberosum TaxID=4113 RepID=M1DQM9_SOLTU